MIAIDAVILRSLAALRAPASVAVADGRAYALNVDYEVINAVRDRHPAWRLLRAGNAALIRQLTSTRQILGFV